MPKGKASCGLFTKKHNYQLGCQGEERAVDFLCLAGYVILERNISYKNDEVDIIALDVEHDEVVFVEVKSWVGGDYWGAPWGAGERRKMQAQARLGGYYMREKRERRDYRFDIVTVVGERVEHYENVSWLF